MKNLSIKIKITMWYTILMVIMAALVLIFMMIVSNSVVSQTAMTQLSQAVRSNLTQIDMENGKLQLGEDFHFYQNGAHILVYSQSEALLAGQVPVAFTADEPFQNGLTRTVDVGDEQYYVLDLWVPLSWDDGVWVRGLLEAPANYRTTQNLFLVAMISMPAFILLTCLGGYWIAKRAFRPLDSIIATAAAINEAKDLSGRIPLPPGNNEFTRLGQTFDQMFERLEESFEAEKQFTSDASHELRTPVSIIKSACEYAEKYDETPEERQETISMIHRQADKMSRLISQLLNMTRLDQRSEQICLEALDLGRLVQSVCQDQAYPMDRITIKLQQDCKIFADEALMTRLIQNLVDNAFKYGKPEGRVLISVFRENGEILLSVEDDGIGIPQEEQEKVWQRFYQVDPSRSGDSGAGLGLSMVRQIAQTHGGWMTLKSAPGEGSTFTLHIPEKNFK